jgi:HlyD family secretion protein
MPKRLVLALVVLAAAAAGAWWYLNRQGGPETFVLTGNVQLRQVSLAFQGSERIAEVLVEEGDPVAERQVVARLDTARLAPQVARARAQVAAQQAVLDELRSGSRPEEIAQAEANLAAAKAVARNAQREFERQIALRDNGTTTQREFDQAQAAADSAQANAAKAERALDLVVAGPRDEEIAQAEAQFEAARSQLDYMQSQLADAELASPVAGVVLSRLMEPGEIASPTRPVVSLARSDPKWVRAYVSETNLGRLRPGMSARVSVDSFPGHGFDGWIGFISPVAEFTPSSVQTEELRTSLVYEVRVIVKDPGNVLRLGMPATVVPQTGEAANAGR